MYAVALNPVSNTPMSLEQIEAAILQLSPEEFRQLAKWFADLDYQYWDRQLEQDIAQGKLESLAQEAIADFESGQYRTI